MRVLEWLTVGLLAACAGNARMGDPAGRVAGSATYRERMALPPDAELRVQLFDMSAQDSAPTQVADTTVRPEGRQVPLPFVLRYDPKAIDPKHVYAVRATILSARGPLFTSTAVVKVITWDHPDRVDLVLTRVADAAAADSAGADTAGSAPGGLWGTTWVLQAVGGAPVSDDAQATLEFPEEGKTAGRGACNHFFGSVTVTDSTIAFGPLGATRMACAEAVMGQETRYLKALQDAERYAVEGNVLLVYVRGMDKPLRFTRRP
ncbi:MAG TPA: YbaY family lipoprotein [Gemmatimonadales bacterium]|nr:YbaY family lipoprotein [Gemmatimonadales bacterium]